MFSDIEAPRTTANNYRRAAGQQTDLNERRRFLSYAAIYDELATRHEERTLDQLKEAQKVISGRSELPESQYPPSLSALTRRHQL